MSNPQPTPREPTPRPRDLEEIARQLPSAHKATLESLDGKGNEGYSEKLIDAIEMIGEEQAAALPRPGLSEVSAGMRYLHSSRTIHQLVTDRNKAVGIFLTVASLLLTASGIISHTADQVDLMIPVVTIRRWCFPVTFAVLTVLSVFVAFLLIRTRVGLIYEVAKMNALLGLPVGRVQRLNPLSIFFLMQGMISLAGGFCAGLLTIFLVYLGNPEGDYAVIWGALVGLVVTLGLLTLYFTTVKNTTSDERLRQAGK